MKKLETEAQFYTQLEKEKTVFVFYADWCPDCRVIDPILPELEEAFKEITFIMVDRDEFIDLCIKYDIYGIPSFLAYDQGKEIARFVSKDRKTYKEIEAFLTKVKQV